MAPKVEEAKPKRSMFRDDGVESIIERSNKDMGRPLRKTPHAEAEEPYRTMFRAEGAGPS